MPFSRPTLDQLLGRAQADIEARLPGADARLRRSVLGVLARVHSAAVHGLYGFLAWISRQVFPDTAEAEYLARWAAIWGVARKSATAASATVQFTGTNGTLVPSATLLLRSDGAEYETAAPGTISGGTATIAITARTAGAGATLTAGAALSLASPIAGISSTATVQSGPVAGTDEEDDDSLRERLLRRIQEPPHGGAAFDYVTWALEVAGVTRAWVFPEQYGIGTVGLGFVRDADGTGAAILPNAGEVSAVQAYIDARRPVTAHLTVWAPTDAPTAFTIHVSPDTAAIRAAVQAELEDLYRREAEPGGTILLSHIREAVSRAVGENDHAITTPAANVTHTAGQMPRVGTITWV